ncbi:hypothetical protein LTR53_006811 [Teratosphaeriaceae sp. CCFEE 6253]|nr:hypothetical protein LTR53_006811 [Teratosphaeriaceae sp. CCFEE 6253]
MHFVTGLLLATAATGAVAKEFTHPKYAGHEEEHEHGYAGKHPREAEPEAMAAWEGAHGGKAAPYKPYGEHAGHGHHARSEPGFPDFKGQHVDTSLKGYAHDLADYFEKLGHPLKAPQHGSQHHARSVPEFDGQDVDTSLDGYDTTLETRAEHFGSHGHEAPHHAEPAHGKHHARSVPDFDGADVDTSEDGYDTTLETRSEHFGGHGGYEAPHHGDSHHHARDAYVKHGSNMPAGGSFEHGGSHHHARDAEAEAYKHFSGEEFAHHGKPHHAREAEAEPAFAPHGHAAHHDFEPSQRPHHAREAEAEPAFLPHEHEHGHEHQGAHAGFGKPSHTALKPTHRFHAREAANAPGEHGGQHAAHKTQAPKKTGGWGFPW